MLRVDLGFYFEHGDDEDLVRVILSFWGKDMGIDNGGYHK